MKEEERRQDIFDLGKGRTKGKSGQLLRETISFKTSIPLTSLNPTLHLELPIAYFLFAVN